MIEEVLGPHGSLAGALPGYEHRPQQLEMAQAVAASLRRRVPLIVEAATGTGKTLAYLVPAVASGLRVVVSTQTKALQDQLFHKDIPLLQGKLGDTEISAVQLKGRRNYLCKLQFESMKLQPAFRSRDDAALWPRILSWAASTETGDRADISGIPDDWPTWNDLSVSSEGCRGQDCPFFDSCWVTTARRRAATAQIIVVNHHLFFADLALKESGFAELLPDFDAVIFDEAHNLEEVATAYFGIELSNYRFAELVGDVGRELEAHELEDDGVEDAASALDQAYKTYLSNLTFGCYEGRYELGQHLAGPAGELSADTLRTTLTALKSLASALDASALSELSPRLAGRARELGADLEFVTGARDERYVYFLELRGRGQFLVAAPIDLASVLRRKLLNKHDRVIFTSATLSTGGGFQYFRQRVGIDPRPGDADEAFEHELTVDELILPPVFDYGEQALVYVPNRLPEPRHPEFLDGACTIIDYLLKLSGGRAFLLFTSYSNLQATWERLSDALPYPTLRQGDAPKNELLEQFRTTPGTVLFATASFWEGVDVVGDALSTVIIDKLPFANPNDPLVKARLELLDRRGSNSFMDYLVPQAALTLKQGFGRLVRSRTDRGVVAILDSRIARKRYGRYFLDTLPPAPVVWRAAEVRDWWSEQEASGIVETG